MARGRPGRWRSASRSSVSHLPGVLANAARGARTTKFRWKSDLVVEPLTLSFSISYLLSLTAEKPSGVVDATADNLPAGAAVVAVGTKTYIKSKKAIKNTNLGIIPADRVRRDVKSAPEASANQRNRGRPSVQQDLSRLWRKFESQIQRWDEKAGR